MKVFMATALLVPLLYGCSIGKERYELSEYINDSIKTFQRKTGEKLAEDSNGVYGIENQLQVIEQKGEITSIIMLPGAEEFSFYGIKVGMSKEVAEEILNNKYGPETSKVINAERNTTVYSYQKNQNELYVSYDIDSNQVVEISYYYIPKEEVKEQQVVESSNSGELLLMVGDVRVYYNEAMVYLKSVQDSYEADFGKGIWNADILGDGVIFGDRIKEEVIKQIVELKVISEKAEELGISLAEEEWAEARAYAREHFERLSDQDVDRYLVSKQLLEQVYGDNLLAMKVFENQTINVDNLVSDLEAKQVTVQHILIRNSDVDLEGKVIPYSAEEKQKAYEKALSLLEKAKETTDFYSLAESNSVAKDIELTFGRGTGPEEYSDVFEQAAFTLKTGQVSELIETEYGWHILYSVSDFNLEASNQVKEDIIEERRNKLFAELYSKWSKDYDVVVNSAAWSAVSFDQ